MSAVHFIFPIGDLVGRSGSGFPQSNQDENDEDGHDEHAQSLQDQVGQNGSGLSLPAIMKFSQNSIIKL